MGQSFALKWWNEATKTARRKVLDQAGWPNYYSEHSYTSLPETLKRRLRGVIKSGVKLEEKFEAAVASGAIQISDDLVYTFSIPTRGGHYYGAVEAETPEAARNIILRLSAGKALKEITGSPSHLSTLVDIDALVISRDFKEDFKEHGYAFEHQKGHLLR